MRWSILVAALVSVALCACSSNQPTDQCPTPVPSTVLVAPDQACAMAALSPSGVSLCDLCETYASCALPVDYVAAFNAANADAGAADAGPICPTVPSSVPVACTPQYRCL